MKRFVSALFFILILTFIWTQSMMPQKMSRAESNFIFNLIRPFLEIFIGKGKVTATMVRKMAHYTEFAFLGLFTSFLFSGKKQSHFVPVLFSFLTCLVIAFFDESIQIFSGRGPAILDVWIDLSGVFIGILVGRIHILSESISQ